MRVSLSTVMIVAATTVANAAWTERTTTDRLTGAKTLQMETAALAPIQQSGHAILPKLTLSCVSPSDTAPYVSAFIVFGELVAVEDASIRYRFDDGAVENRLAGVSRGGDYFQITAIKEVFLGQLRNASRLRVELPLLAGNAFMEFNTKGAESAVNKAQCR